MLLLAAAVFAPLYNFVLIVVENLLFLLFPTRVMVTTPGDFQAMGRNVLTQLGKLVGIGGGAPSKKHEIRLSDVVMRYLLGS